MLDVKETITSSGLEKEEVSYNHDFDERSFQHSTSWEINDNDNTKEKLLLIRLMTL